MSLFAIRSDRYEKALVVLALHSLTVPLSALPPKVSSVDIHGWQIGKPTTLIISGTDLLPNPRVLTGIQIAKQTLKDGGKPNRIILEIEPAKGVQPGLYNWWLVTDQGVSTRQVIAVDHLPQKVFADQTNSLPVALHGTISGSQVREVTFPGKGGQEIICEVEARRLDSKLRPVLKLLSPNGHRLNWSLPMAVLHGDTRIRARLTADGQYRLQLHDLQFAAPAPNHFRLKIGQWTYADQAFPAMVQRGASAEVELVGDSGTRKVSLPAIADARAVPAPWKNSARASGPAAPVWLSDVIELLEKRNGSEPQSLSLLPVAVNGRLSVAGEEDAYEINVKPETEIIFKVAADIFGSPIDAELELRDTRGKRLALNDDANNQPDPQLTYKVPKNVTNLVALVRDVNANGGPRCIYRLSAVVKAPKKNDDPGYSLIVPEDSLTVPISRIVVYKVEVERDGFEGPVQLAFGRLPEGVRVSGQSVPAGANGTLLTLASDKPLPPFITELRGRSKDRQSLASCRNEQVGQFQPWLENDLALAGATKPAIDFTVDWTAVTNSPNIPLGGKVSLAVNCRRPLGHDGPVRLTLMTSQRRQLVNGRVDNNKTLREEKAVLIAEDKAAQKAFDAIAAAEKILTAAKKATETAKDDKSKAATGKKLNEAQAALTKAEKDASIAATKSKGEGKITLVVPGELPEVTHQIAFKAELLKRDRRTVEAVFFTPVRNLPILNPLAVKVAKLAPVKLDAKKGATFELAGKVERRGGAKGDVTVTLEGLPAGVTAPKTVTVKKGQSDFKFALKFPARFKPGEFASLKLFATGKPFNAAQVRSSDTKATLKVLPPDPVPAKKPVATK